MQKRLQIFSSLVGTFGVGWQRDDAPMLHVFANAAPGEPFRPANDRGGPHWPCEVCKVHGFTEQDFREQIHDLRPATPDPEAMQMWVVYERPRDYPEGFIARKHCIKAGVTWATSSTIKGTIEDIRREMIERRLTCLSRLPDDDPVIVETWV